MSYFFAFVLSASVDLSQLPPPRDNLENTAVGKKSIPLGDRPPISSFLHYVLRVFSQNRTTQTWKGHPSRQSLTSPWEGELECGLKRKKALLVTSNSSSKNFPWRCFPWSPSYRNSALSGPSSSLPVLSPFLFSPPPLPTIFVGKNY